MTGPDVNEPSALTPPPPDRATLLRDIVVLQFKLIADGLRDFILVPVSLTIGLVSLLRTGNRPGTEFYDLLHYGRHTDRVINLFGAARRVHPHEDDETSMPDIDELVGRVESFVVEEYRRGEVTAQAKQRFDSLRETIRRHARSPTTWASEDDRSPD